MNLTDEEKDIVRYMYENMNNVAILLDIRLNGYGITTNDVYHLFEKLGLIEIIYES